MISPYALFSKGEIHSKEFVDDGILIELEWIELIALCEQYGDMPLPPYITQANTDDKLRYKTSFGHRTGSVAAPTAGLHFTSKLRQILRQNHISREEITLHVGIGTFAPVVSEDIRDHQLHAEYITIDSLLFEHIYQQKISWKPIITIGTTSTRTIESLPYLFHLIKDDIREKITKECYDRRYSISILPQNGELGGIVLRWEKISFLSSLFIYPWFERKIIDGLITNFHLPWTSLVMLVAGLLWYDNRKQSYQYALAFDYRFASFGDGMLILF
jgi:S-adenosylmethionine:tRNA ribosyltransferase-isomerase